MKKNICTRFLNIVLMLVIILACLSGIVPAAFAAETQQDGLEVSLTTNHSAYDQDETIEVTLTVKNTN